MQYRQRGMTTTMCVKRAGLVWALLLLATTYFILTCAVPVDETGGHNTGESKGNGSGNITEEHPSVSTIPPVASMDEVNSSEKTTKETSDTPAVSNDPNGGDNTDEYLYYEIKKRIFYEHSLYLSGINYVLSQKDDGRQFMYALADKLGYMSKSGKPNDPHIPVIRSHRDKLIKLLEKMAAKKESKPPVSHEGPSVSSNETPASKEPPSLNDINKISFEVSDGIHHLDPDVIRRILSELTFSDALGYAVGIKLGYSQEDERMKLLENADADELKKNLQQTLESKTTSKTIPDDSFDSSQSEPTPIPPTTKSASKEPPSPSDINKIAFEVSVDIHYLGPDAIQDILSDATFPDALGYAVGIKLGYSHGDEHMKYLENADAYKLKKILQQTLESNTIIPKEPKQLNEPTDLPVQSTKAPSANTKLDKSKSGDSDGTRPTDYANTVGSVLTDKSAPDDGGLELIPKIDESERVNLLNSKGFQNYLSKTYGELYELFVIGEADPNEIDLALEEYLEWPSQGSDFMEDERGGDEPEAGEGETVHRIPYFF